MADEADNPAGATSDTASTQTTAAGTDASATAAAAGAGDKATGTGTAAILATDTDTDAATTTAGPQDFPADWRERMASDLPEKDRPAFLKKAARYTTPSTFGAGAWNGWQRAAQVRDPLPEGATPEQAAAWRKAAGLPVEATEYNKSLPEGLVIGERDKPILDRFFTQALETNTDPKVAAKFADWWFKERELQTQQLDEQISNFGAEAVEMLRAEWGGEYKQHVNAVTNMLNGLPKEAADALRSARRADGMPLLDDVAVFKAIANIARELDPHATLVPNSNNPAAAVETEIDTIQKTMRDEPNKYWGDKKMQDRYSELLAARERGRARAA